MDRTEVEAVARAMAECTWRPGDDRLWVMAEAAIAALDAVRRSADYGEIVSHHPEGPDQVVPPQGEDHEAAPGQDRGAEVEPHGRSGRGEPSRAAEPSRTALPSPAPPRDLLLDGIEAAAAAMTDWPDEWDEHDERDKDVFRQMARDGVAAYLSRCPSPERDDSYSAERGRLLDEIGRLSAPERDTERLVEALREIKRVAAIEAPPVSDEVPAKVWKIAHEALAEFSPVSNTTKGGPE